MISTGAGRYSNNGHLTESKHGSNPSYLEEQALTRLRYKKYLGSDSRSIKDIKYSLKLSDAQSLAGYIK